MGVDRLIDLAVRSAVDEALDRVPVAEQLPGRKRHLDDNTRMAKVIGVRVRMKKIHGNSCPTAEVAVLTGTRKTADVVEEFVLAPQGADLAARIGDLGSAFANRVNGLNPDIVVVRRADRPAHSSNREGPRERLIAEGALVHAAVSCGKMVLLLSGRDLAARTKISKDSLDAEGAALGGGKYYESVAAALAVLGQLSHSRAAQD